MDRRQFILAGAATASASTVMGLPAFTSGGSGGRIARPEIFKLRTSETDDRVAQAHRTQPITLSDVPRTPFTVTLQALDCAQNRMGQESAVDIELRHPGSGVDALIYSASNAVPLGSFPPGIRASALPDSRGTGTLIVTQRYRQHHQQHKLRVVASEPGDYLLAIPTAPGARVPIWRASTIELDEGRTPARVRSLFEARAKLCMLVNLHIAPTHAL